MISLKKYLDEQYAAAEVQDPSKALLPAYRSLCQSTLVAIGNASAEACPALGADLKDTLTEFHEKLDNADADEVAAVEQAACNQVRDWGARAARNLNERTGEVRDLLLVLACTGESLALRDQHCAEQIGEVTTRLQSIVTLDDLRQIRSSIEKNASELKDSISRMATEGKNAVEHLRIEVDAYRNKLEAAEYIAAFDSLTGLGSRLWTESQIECRIAQSAVFSIALLDIDGFKQVNDTHGHLAGDDVLRLFAAELKNACRASDIAGRWGGDEFIVLLDNELEAARNQTRRLRQWVSGSYTIQGRSGPYEQLVCVSIGIAEFKPNDTVQSLLERADQEMYREKDSARQHTVVLPVSRTADAPF